MAAHAHPEEGLSTVLLTKAEGHWHYALHGDSGVVQGLVDVVSTADVEQAQARLLVQVTQDTGHHYLVSWHQDEGSSWSALLRPVEPRRDVRARTPVVARSVAVFLATWVLFYVTGWHEESPLYIGSEGTYLVVTLAWVAVGLVLLAARQRSWGVAWLVGSSSFVGGYVALGFGVVLALGS